MLLAGPHIDGGSVERWEDPSMSHLTARVVLSDLTGEFTILAYRKCFSKLLTPFWREHDPFDATYRLDAIMDMYKGQGAVRFLCIKRPHRTSYILSPNTNNVTTVQCFPAVPRLDINEYNTS